MPVPLQQQYDDEERDQMQHVHHAPSPIATMKEKKNREVTGKVRVGAWVCGSPRTLFGGDGVHLHLCA